MVNTLVEGNLTIDKIEPGSDWITTETETNEKGKKYTIVIKLDKDKLPKGTLRERVNIHTKYNERIEVTPVIIEAKVI